jgi:catechol 2,3-dioxygenase-like lactoylglutathione lyase family enzyme
MRINVTSVLVDDQDKALRFYTEVLGFVKKTEIPLGEARWERDHLVRQAARARAAWARPVSGSARSRD